MKCPNCNYEPEFSPDNDEYVLGEGRFFELGIDAKQEENATWRGSDFAREEVYGCPRCGVMFMNRGFRA